MASTPALRARLLAMLAVPCVALSLAFPCAVALAVEPPNFSTRIVARLPAGARVDGRIYDTAGREVRALFQGTLPAGEHVLTWDGTTAPGSRARAGVYFLRLFIGATEFQRRVVLLGRS